MFRIAMVLAALVGLSAPALAGGIVVPAEERYIPYSANMPNCEDSGVLGFISSAFAGKESGYWNSSLTIASFDKVREIGFRANGLGYIPRRFCVARATLSDTKQHTVIYEVQTGLGFAGYGHGVEWCVVGYDRDLAYAPACSALRPYVDRYLGEAAIKARY